MTLQRMRLKTRNRILHRQNAGAMRRMLRGDAAGRAADSGGKACFPEKIQRARRASALLAPIHHKPKRNYAAASAGTMLTRLCTRRLRKNFSNFTTPSHLAKRV